MPMATDVRLRGRVPASKSWMQRVLLLEALAGERAEHRGLVADTEGDDVRALRAALDAVGLWSAGDDAWGGSRDRRILDAGLGATGFRFLLAAATLRPQGARSLVTGRPALLRRPHRPLARALARWAGPVKRRGSGAYRLRGRGRLPAAALSVPGEVSSQFASALLLVAARSEGLCLLVTGKAVSRPYLALTVELLRAFGGVIEVDPEAGGTRYIVRATELHAAALDIPPDASAAAVRWAAAALWGGDCVVEGLRPEDPQADLALLPVLTAMGAQIGQTDEGWIRVAGSGARLRAAGGRLAAGCAGPPTPRGRARSDRSRRDARAGCGPRAPQGSGSHPARRCLLDCSGGRRPRDRRRLGDPGTRAAPGHGARRQGPPARLCVLPPRASRAGFASHGVSRLRTSRIRASEAIWACPLSME